MLLLLLCVFVSCDDNEELFPEESDLPTLRVLCIGNSFTEDSFSYVPSLFAQASPGVRLIIGIAYIGGSPLEQHYVNLTGKSIEVNQKQIAPAKYVLHMASSSDGRWIDTGRQSIDKVLTREKWDIITFQQSGVESVRDYETYYAPYIKEIKPLVEGKIGSPVRLGWVLTHGCYHVDDKGLRDNWLKTAENSGKVMQEGCFELLFPYGTAIQNLRETTITNESDNLGWTADGGHLQEGLGCLAAAYANTLILLQDMGLDIDEITFNFMPTKSLVGFLNVPNPQFGKNGVVGINPYNCSMALKAAKAAVKTPYEITPIED